MHLLPAAPLHVAPALVLVVLLAALSFPNNFVSSEPIYRFVSPLGDDANANCTLLAPCATIQRAITVAQSDDIIYLLPGDHYINYSIVLYKPVVFRAENSTVAYKTRILQTASAAQQQICEYDAYKQTPKGYRTFCSMFIVEPSALFASEWESFTVNFDGGADSAALLEIVPVYSFLSAENICFDLTTFYLNFVVKNVKFDGFSMGLLNIPADVTSYCAQHSVLLRQIRVSTSNLMPVFSVQYPSILNLGFVYLVQIQSVTFDSVVYRVRPSDDSAVHLVVRHYSNRFSINGIWIRDSEVTRLDLKDHTMVSMSYIHVLGNRVLGMNPVISLDTPASSSIMLSDLTMINNQRMDVASANKLDTTSSLVRLNMGVAIMRSSLFIDNKDFASLIDTQQATLQVFESRFFGNHSTTSSCIFVAQAQYLSVYTSYFDGCRSDSMGGAILSMALNVVIQDSTFRSCSSIGGGGALAISTPQQANILRSTFEYCSARRGGAVFVSGIPGSRRTRVVLRGTFNSNTALESGGGLHMLDGVLAILGSVVFNGNSAYEGGSLKLSSVSLAVTGSSPPVLSATNCHADFGACFALEFSYTSSHSDFLEFYQNGTLQCMNSIAGKTGDCLYIGQAADENALTQLQTVLSRSGSTTSRISTYPSRIVLKELPLSISPSIPFRISLQVLDALNYTVVQKPTIAYLSLRSINMKGREEPLHTIVLSDSKEVTSYDLSLSSSIIGSDVVMSLSTPNNAFFLPVRFTVQGCPVGYAANSERTSCIDVTLAIIAGTVGGAVALVLLVSCIAFACVALHQARKRIVQYRLVDKLLAHGSAYESLVDYVGHSNNNSGSGIQSAGLRGLMPSTMIIDADDLQIVDMIAAGSYATVFSGILRGATPVAIKLFPKNSFIKDVDADVGDFVNECIMLSRFSTSPNTVRFLGCSDFGNKFAIVTELMRGSLASLIQKSNAFKRDERCWAIAWEMKLRLLRGIAAGLAYLHGAGVVHRDIKPENVLVNDGEFVARISDFGLSRSAAVSPNKTMNVGTSAFMSPEMISYTERSRVGQPDAYSQATDTYSFGILTYCLIAETVHPYTEDISDIDLLFYVKGLGRRPYVDEQQFFAACKLQCEEEGLSSAKTNQAILYLQATIEMMYRCWQYDASARPSMKQISAELAKLGYRTAAAYDAPESLKILVLLGIFKQDIDRARRNSILRGSV